jgi:hypothetical protein
MILLDIPPHSYNVYKHFDRFRRVMPEEQAFSLVELFNLRHILVGQRKVENVKIFLHALLVGGLRNNDHIALNIENYDISLFYLQ